MIISLLKYPRGESNPYQKFRKLPFYPLNYQGYGLAVCVFCQVVQIYEHSLIDTSARGVIWLRLAVRRKFF